MKVWRKVCSLKPHSRSECHVRKAGRLSSSSCMSGIFRCTSEHKVKLPQLHPSATFADTSQRTRILCRNTHAHIYILHPVRNCTMLLKCVKCFHYIWHVCESFFLRMAEPAHCGYMCVHSDVRTTPNQITESMCAVLFIHRRVCVCAGWVFEATMCEESSVRLGQVGERVCDDGVCVRVHMNACGQCWGWVGERGIWVTIGRICVWHVRNLSAPELCVHIYFCTSITF